MIGGHLTLKILLEEAVSQGNIISPFIFIIAVQILLIKIKKTKKSTTTKVGWTSGRNKKCIIGHSKLLKDITIDIAWDGLFPEYRPHF